MTINHERCGFERTRGCARASCRDAPMCSYFMRDVLIAFLVSFMVALPCAYGVEDYRILWGPTVVPGPSGGGGGGHPIEVSGDSGSGAVASNSSDMYGVIVYAYTKYDAALLVCGFDPSDTRITTDIKNRLKSSSEGGDFYDFASGFRSLGTGTSYEIPDFFGNDITNQMNLYGVCAAGVALYGASRVWQNLYTQAQMSDAKAVVNRFIYGGTSGGGGGSGSGAIEGNTVTLTIAENGVTESLKYTGVQLVDLEEIRVTLNSDLIGELNNGAVLVAAKRQTNVYLTIVDGLDDADLLFDDTYGDGVNYVASWHNGTEDAIAYKRTARNFTISANNYVDGVLTVDIGNSTWDTDDYIDYSLAKGAIYNCPTSSSSVSTNSGKTNLIGYYDGSGSGGGGGGGGSDTPVPDPDPDPDPPSPPSPPDPVVPDPPEPTPPTPPTPIQPIVINPTVPTVTVTTETFTIDLSGILDAMDVHCMHLQQMMIDCSEYLADSLAAEILTYVDYLSGILADNTEYIGDCIAEYFENLYSYMSECAQWIVDHLNFNANVNVEPYDDTSLMYWLRRIWAKLGPTETPNKPSDPVTDWDPWGEWLKQLVQHIIDMLTGGIADAVTSVGGVMETLSHVFPFCIPFDLLLLVDAMTTTAITPQISITLPETDWYDEYTIDIDCEPYDDAMEIVRSMELIAFVVYVMLHSDELFAWKPEDFYKWGAG